MTDQRLLNCAFIKDMEVSNKAKLLYLMFFINADDKGFVGNASKIIEGLESNEESIDIANNYNNALDDLVQKGLLFAFTNNHGGYVYLIRHWYYHNKYYSKAWTNYKRLLKRVRIEDGEYVLRNPNDPLDDSESYQPKNGKLDREAMLKALEEGEENHF